ncbi:MAG: fibronectin type III domain-containing protein [Actinomycetota bacterium]|nr:fibronectin type III domain-containing protein [Actinomycetota bacterium]MDQ2957054.1 fibronectin type III domain-containing protein [Actinomycetota bacterium]
MAGQSALAATGDPYYSTVVATPGFTTQGLTFDASGTMYVAATALRSIDRVNSDGSLTPVVSSGLQGASGILADGNKGLYIADTNNSLLKYWDATTGVVTTLSSAVATPHGLTWGPDGDVYIADSINNRIAKWDPTTSTLSAAAYNLNYPSDVAVAPNGDIYAADTSNHRIAYFPASNPYVPQTLVSNVSYPLGVALDKDGNLFFADLSNQLIEERNASTGVVSTIWHTSNNIYGLRFGPDGSLYMTDSSQILKLNPYSAPSAPKNLSTTAGDGSIDLTFDVPDNSGGAAISGYEVSSDGGNSWATATTTGSGPFTTTVSGLTNGTSYALQVRADNSIGNGTVATADPTIPDVAPAAPTDLTATANGAGSIDLSFTAPVANDGSAITGYQESTDGGAHFAPLTVDDSATPITATVSGLTHGTTYAVQVRAVNAGGPGAAATANDADPTDVPSAPQAVAATSADKSLDVQFQAPSSDGGLTITKYQASVDGTKWTDVATTAGSGAGVLDTSVDGLTTGTPYTVQLRAVNADGPGAAGTADPATPLGVPGAPTGLTATAGNGSARLSFSPPADNGGSDISSYQYTVDGGDHWLTLNVDQLPGVIKSNLTPMPSTATVTGLTNDRQYQLQIRAVNAQGNGTASDPTSVTPAAPVPPVMVRINGAATQVVPVGSTVTISGTAAAGSSVRIYLRQRGQTGYVLRRILTATGSGTFSTSYVAGDDYRYYAQVGSTVSGSVLTQVAPTVTGPLSQTVKKNSTVVLKGSGVAGSTVQIHFQVLGATNTIVRDVVVAANGRWTRSYLATASCHLYVSAKTNGIVTRTYLVLAR